MNRPDIEVWREWVAEHQKTDARLAHITPDAVERLLDYVEELEADLEAARHIISSQPLEPPTVIAKPESDYVRRSIDGQSHDPENL
ncbi:MAG: hypothetical protein ACR2RE_12935 [Geminicoccaceae bacterium]